MSDQVQKLQDFSGAILLIVGLFALGLFNFRSDEPLVEAGITAQTRVISDQSVHGVAIEVDGRDIHVTGLADSAAERDAILTALREIEGRGKLSRDLNVLQVADPFLFRADMNNSRIVDFTGNVPTEGIRRDWRLNYGETVDALVLASGRPDEQWTELVSIGLRALKRLESGQLVAENRRFSLSGQALTPSVTEGIALLLEDLPDGYNFTLNIEELDDGTPLRLSASRLDGGELTLSGKLPVDLAQVLSVGQTKVEVSPLAQPVPNWDDGVLAGLEALAALRSGQLVVIGPSLTLTGEAWSQSAYDAANDALDEIPAAMTATVQITLADSGAPFALHMEFDGAEARVNGKVPRSLAPPVLEVLLDAPLRVQELEIARISPEDQWWEAARLGVQAMRHLEHGRLSLEGDALSLSGLAYDPKARDLVQDILNGLPYGYKLNFEIDLADDGTPHRMVIIHDGLQAHLTGKVPDTWDPSQLNTITKQLAIEDLITTPKSAPEGWEMAAITGARAAAQLMQGQIELQEKTLYLSGIIRDPKAERDTLAILKDLPEGFGYQADLTFLDDGRPFVFVLEYDGDTARLSGKVPRDLGVASQGAILGHTVQDAGVELAGIPADPDWWSAARAAIKALGALESGRLRVDSHQISLVGTGDELAAERWLKPYESSFKISVSVR